MGKKKLIKDKCEVCYESNSKILELHHIIEQNQINTTNNNFNLAILCSNCHSLTHAGELKLIGVYPSTYGVNHRVLVYELNGVKNIDIDIPYIEFKNKSYKI